MTDFYVSDRPDHNLIVEQRVETGDTLHISAGDRQDTVKVSGGGNVDAHLGEGNDYFNGSHAWGNMTVHGNGGNDVIIGGHGNDYIDGGDFRDVLTGGDGNDTFHFGRMFSSTGGDPYTTRAGSLNKADIVTDFHCGDVAQFDGWLGNMKWDSAHGDFLNPAGHVVAHFTGTEGHDMVETSHVGSAQEWMLV